MKEPLPYFHYHPGAVGNGSIVPARRPCSCCDRLRGYISGVSLYSQISDVFLCPWCIADGRADSDFDGSFNGVETLLEEGVDPEIAAEIKFRTPGLHSQQEFGWPAHCGDAAIYVTNIRDSDRARRYPGAHQTIHRALVDFAGEEVANELPDGLIPELDCHLFFCPHCRSYEVVITAD